MPPVNSLYVFTADDLQSTTHFAAGAPLVESNCACPDTDRLLWDGPAMESDLTQFVRPVLYLDQLPQGMFLVFNPLAASGPAVMNWAAWEFLDSFAEPRRLEGAATSPERRQAFRRLVQLGLLEPAGGKRGLQRGAAKTLTAWLHTTNACNLRCTYCYVDKSDEAMDEATGRAAVEAIFRSAQRHGYRQVKLKYAGGEATLNFGLVRQLHSYAAELATQTGIALRGVVLSNGVALTNGMIDFIHDSGLTLMISLDGVGAGHDAQRIFANGRGSARQVTRSIDRALARGVSPHLSITVTSRNADDVAEAVAFALARDLLFNLNFYRDHDAGGDQAMQRAEDEQLIAGIRKAFALIEQNPPRHSLLASLVDRANFATVHETACGAGHSYLVVDQRGGVARCQMEIEQTVTDVFAADPLSEIRLYPQGFQNVGVDEKEGCRACHWRYWCAGGCPALTYRVTGRNDVKSPYCHVYKAIYPELLRLEGLRLLTYAEQEAVR